MIDNGNDVICNHRRQNARSTENAKCKMNIDIYLSPFRLHFHAASLSLSFAALLLSFASFQKPSPPCRPPFISTTASCFMPSHHHVRAFSFLYRAAPSCAPPASHCTPRFMYHFTSPPLLAPARSPASPRAHLFEEH